MKLSRMSFNNYLLCCLLVCLAVGCVSSEERTKRKEASTLRLFLEADQDAGSRGSPVPIYRAAPMPVNVERAPFLDEGHLTGAAVVDVVGGFAIQVSFDFHGTLMLENVSTANRGKRIAVYSQFTEGRWLAAPKITQRIADGVLTFTPDATREEADRIVRGLNNVAVSLKNKSKS
jgi:preprotein translocase subunit SecD